uniref:Uncharacterized protein n=1 Tax=Physcomitrium patens TaxID=3218 RepID=A0A2K1INZ9_PHYPA|nr:hypothetical protein PHYPA_027316 [Physcomitrium patens]
MWENELQLQQPQQRSAHLYLIYNLNLLNNKTTSHFLFPVALQYYRKMEGRTHSTSRFSAKSSRWKPLQRWASRASFRPPTSLRHLFTKILSHTRVLPADASHPA